MFTQRVWPVKYFLTCDSAFVVPSAADDMLHRDCSSHFGSSSNVVLLERTTSDFCLLVSLLRLQ